MVTGPRLRSIVLIEDDPDMRLLMGLCLRPDPRITIAAHATNANDAVGIAEAFAPDLIVLDHELDGDITGLRIAPVLKSLAPAAKVLLCSTVDRGYEARAEPAVDAFLRKDRIRDLLPTVQRLLGLEPPAECA